MFSMSIIISHARKHIWEICDENVSNKKTKKNQEIFKMKYINQILLGKWLFSSIKGHFCLTKVHLANLERQLEIKSTSSEVIFDTID